MADYNLRDLNNDLLSGGISRLEVRVERTCWVACAWTCGGPVEVRASGLGEAIAAVLDAASWSRSAHLDAVEREEIEAATEEAQARYEEAGEARYDARKAGD